MSVLCREVAGRQKKGGGIQNVKSVLNSLKPCLVVDGYEDKRGGGTHKKMAGVLTFIFKQQTRKEGPF